MSVTVLQKKEKPATGATRNTSARSLTFKVCDLLEGSIRAHDRAWVGRRGGEWCRFFARSVLTGGAGGVPEGDGRPT
ncbi:hypothetical protein BRADI_1g07185v3 [Brachypodium distachyon]|uniref:Uncharacterized protein n=1 Tax=Brachypodium distachyon TaxID=15368 RepID=A0A0Q3RIF3_BRADI|nr:hypothetical protein BRADI_1g07185v3 [Brachypodium distachyon]